MRQRQQFGMRESPASDRRHGSRQLMHGLSDDPRVSTEIATAPSADNANAASTRAATVGEMKREEQLLTVDEVATRLSVSRNWVYNHADAIGGYRLGKYLRFSWPRVLERLGR